MKWVQKDKDVYLQGFGWNYPENLYDVARFSKLKVRMGSFQDQTQLGQNLKLKSFDFTTNASEVIKCDAYGTRQLLNSDLQWMDEEEHKEKVKMIIKERKEVKIKGLKGLQILEEFT